MAIELSKASLSNLRGVHPDLVRVVKRAATLADPDAGFRITEGVRTKERQRELFKARATRTMNSRHIPGKDGFAKAFDIACEVKGAVRWDWPLYSAMAKVIKRAAKLEGVPIEWGGDWTTFRDGPHFQLPHAKYP